MRRRVGAVAVALAALAWAAAAATAGLPAAAAPGLPAAPLARVEWVGNAAVPAEVLGDSTGWRALERLPSEALTALARGVAGAYAARGYLEAEAESVSFAGDAAGPVARVTVREGPWHRFGELEMVGARSLRPGEAPALLGVRAGEPWSGARLTAGIGRLLRRYEDLGRPLTQVQVRRVGVDGDRVRAEIHVVEGDSVVVASAGVRGARRTRGSLLARALRGIEARPYARERAEEGRARLVDLGVFASVGEPRLRLTAPGRGELSYEVSEAPASGFEGVFGYQGRGGTVSGLGRLTLDNVAGTGRQADASWLGRGAGRSEFRFRYREPYLLGSGVAAGLGFVHELDDTVYSRTEYGVEAALPLGEGGSLALALEAGRAVATLGTVARTSWQGTRATLRRHARGWRDPAEPGARPGYSVALTTSQRFTHDRLRAGGAERGRLLTLGLEAAAEGAAGRGRFLAGAIEARWRDGDGEELAAYDLFPLGGAASLRGYREGELRVGRYALLRLDHGWGGAATRVFVFLDQAVYSRPGAGVLSTDEAATGYRAGYGFGASVPSALGRVGLDVGWGRGDGPLDAKLHLRLRSRF